LAGSYLVMVSWQSTDRGVAVIARPARSRLIVTALLRRQVQPLAELVNGAHQVIDDPGRRAVQLKLAGAALVLPWADGEAFARRLLAIAAADLQPTDPAGGWVFFDRGLLDAAAALAHAIGELAREPAPVSCAIMPGKESDGNVFREWVSFVPRITAASVELGCLAM
jgi:hypothetical protein